MVRVRRTLDQKMLFEARKGVMDQIRLVDLWDEQHPDAPWTDRRRRLNNLLSALELEEKRLAK